MEDDAGMYVGKWSPILPLNGLPDTGFVELVEKGVESGRLKDGREVEG